MSISKFPGLGNLNVDRNDEATWYLTDDIGVGLTHDNLVVASGEPRGLRSDMAEAKSTYLTSLPELVRRRHEGAHAGHAFIDTARTATFAAGHSFGKNLEREHMLAAKSLLGVDAIVDVAGDAWTAEAVAYATAEGFSGTWESEFTRLGTAEHGTVRALTDQVRYKVAQNEARTNLAAIIKALAAYIEQQGGERAVPRLPASAGQVPPEPPRAPWQSSAGDWAEGTWLALGFSLQKPQRCAYSIESSFDKRVGVVRAACQLNTDGPPTVFERQVAVQSGALQAQPDMRYQFDDAGWSGFWDAFRHAVNAKDYATLCEFVNYPFRDRYWEGYDPSRSASSHNPTTCGWRMSRLMQGDLPERVLSAIPEKAGSVLGRRGLRANL